MGMLNLVHEESWRTAQLVVNHFEVRLDDEEIVVAFHAVREIIADSLRRCLERHERELTRLVKNPASES